MTECSASLVVTEMHVKNITKYHDTTRPHPQLGSLITLGVGENTATEKEPPVGGVKSVPSLRKTAGIISHH